MGMKEDRADQRWIIRDFDLATFGKYLNLLDAIQIQSLFYSDLPVGSIYAIDPERCLKNRCIHMMMLRCKR